MPSDIVRKLAEDGGAAAPPAAARAIEQLWKADTSPQTSLLARSHL